MATAVTIADVNSPPLLSELPYSADSAARFAWLARQPWAAWLDSGPPHSRRRGRYDILAADPWLTLVTHGAFTEIRARGQLLETSAADPFELLRRYLRPGSVPLGQLPFSGGALGYFGYDLGRRLEHLPELAEDADGLPQMAVGLYDWALVSDHVEQRSWLVSAGRDPATRARWGELWARFRRPPQGVTPPPLRRRGPLRPSLDFAAYAARFERIQAYIHAGDCYQVNFALRFSAPVGGDPWASYLRLRRANPAPFAAYLNIPAAQIVCASPERFLHLRGGQVETRPIKGTRPRHPDPARDAELAAELCASVKDRAENLMIVDLLRNDLGKTCRPGSIRVPELFSLESYPSVHHLVSSVRGELAPGHDALHLLRGCFPGGSITGAPKLRAMQIIEELEPQRRGVYCGSIGYCGHDGQLDSNIVIRSLVHREGEASLWAGGGIVADSQVAQEYQECHDKAAALLHLL